MKHTVEAFLHYSTNEWEVGKLGIYPFDMSGRDHSRSVLVKTFDIEVEVPDNFDPRPEQIKQLEKKQQEAAAAFHALTIEIKRQISELQSLENSSQS